MSGESKTDAAEVSVNPHIYAGAKPQTQLESSTDFDKSQFLLEILRSRRELEIARRQFDQVAEPELIDHAVFRVGAAERHLNYLFRLARTWGISYEDNMEWDWTSDEWKID